MMLGVAGNALYAGRLRVARVEWQMWGELHTDNIHNH